MKRLLPAVLVLSASVLLAPNARAGELSALVAPGIIRVNGDLELNTTAPIRLNVTISQGTITFISLGCNDLSSSIPCTPAFFDQTPIRTLDGTFDGGILEFSLRYITPLDPEPPDSGQSTEISVTVTDLDTLAVIAFKDLALGVAPDRLTTSFRISPYRQPNARKRPTPRPRRDTQRHPPFSVEQ